MGSRYTTIQQHEPLRIPSNWGSQEKRLIAQLEETFDDIYRRFGRLKLSDLSESLRREVSSTIDGVKTHSTLIEQNAQEIVLKAEQIETLNGQVGTLDDQVSALSGQMKSAQTSITQNAQAIVLKADGVVQDDGSVAAQSVSTSSVKVTANGVDITTDGTFTVDGSNFSVDADGKVTANGAIIDGTVRSNGALTLTQLDIHIGESEPEIKRTGMVWIKPAASAPPAPTMTTAVYSHTFAGTVQPLSKNYVYGTLTGRPEVKAGDRFVYVLSLPVFAYRQTDGVIITCVINGIYYAGTFNFPAQGYYTFEITVTDETRWYCDTGSISFTLMANESRASNDKKDCIRNAVGYTMTLTCYSYSN